MANYDEVERACQRCGVKLGSALERDVRQSIWSIAGNDFNEPSRSQRIDRFLNEQKIAAYYAESLESAPPRKAVVIEKIDTLRMTAEQHAQVMKDGLAASVEARNTSEGLPRMVSFTSREEFEQATRNGLK